MNGHLFLCESVGISSPLFRPDVSSFTASPPPPPLDYHRPRNHRRQSALCGAGASPRSFDWGRGILTGEGTDSGESKPPTHKFLFSLGFRPLYFENF